MKIKCLSTKKTVQQEKNYSEKLIHNQDLSYEFLDIGKEYNVYGMIIKHGQVWYYICDRVHELFPIASPPHLFEIIDNRLSRYWVFGVVVGFEKYPLWIFPEWINEPYFQDNLTDGEEREVNIFRAYKERMDLELPDNTVTEIAQVGDEKWLICTDCLDAWESSDDRDAMVRCPKCKKIFHNPRYRNEWPHL